MIYESRIAIPAGLELLLLIGLLLAGLVWVLSGGRRRGLPPGLAIGLAAAGFATVFGLALANIRTRHEPIAVQHSLKPVPQIDTSAPPASPAWLEADEHFLEADLYPSAVAAARGLAADLADELASVTTARQRPDVLTVMHLKNLNTSAEADAVANVLRERAPEVEVVRSGEGSTVSSPVLLMILRTETRRVGDLLHQESYDGRVLATLVGPGGDVKREAKYVHKPWVEDFADYLTKAPLPGHWLIAQSASPALDPNEAMEQATRDAAGKLATYLRARLTEVLPREWTTLHGHRINEPHLIPTIEAELNRGGFISDRFLQQFHRPSGSVYRALLLVNVDPLRIDKLAAAYQQKHVQQRTRVISLAVSIFVLLAVLTGLYLFLNMATKGYYTSALRLAVVIAIVLGMGFLVLA